jgi:hypothetical protein
MSWPRRAALLGGVAALAGLAAVSIGGAFGSGDDGLASRFHKGTLEGTDTENVTTLDLGPDGRLYVGTQHGLIEVYEVERHGKGDYEVTDTETIADVQSILNHDDDGEENIEDVTRQVTGLLAVGTSADPVLYVSSSDPRIGGGGEETDKNLDTNSGVVSRLTRDPATGKWGKADLVRGLPRSEENHSPNGMALTPDGKTLLLAQGGHTNNGAPSPKFARLPEYALSAAILAIDLAAIGDGTYDLPTLDDPDREGAEDAYDPFGGNDGKNQARLVPGGPVRIYAPGFRNAYDLLVARDGRLWTIDNGANPTWGDTPRVDSADGGCTNDLRPGGGEQLDILHLVTADGYYGGHPNPTRANRDNLFAGQSPVEVANPVECDHREGPEAGALATFPASTNGLAEYRSDRVDAALDGDLLAAGFDNRIYRVDIGPDGEVVGPSVLFEEVDSVPLDVTAQGDDEIFPGTIWVGDYGTGKITVFEPR